MKEISSKVVDFVDLGPPIAMDGHVAALHLAEN
jgi:hypothetical protein